MSSLQTAAMLGGAPAAAMAVFSVIGLWINPPKNLTGAMQHFAAGILLSAVAQELVPPMTKAKGVHENAAVVIGFSLGVMVMILIGILCPEPELEEEDEAEKALSDKEAPKERPLVRRSSSKIQQALVIGKKASDGDEPLLEKGATAFPATFFTAVVIDGAMDGLLLGIASAASESAGLVLSISLAIEMSFLGLTLATSMKGQPKSKSLPAVFAAPLAIIIAAGIGGFFAGMLASNETFKVGLFAFGCSALIFMVAEELLLEAHEDGGEHVWWVDTMLYVGFLASIYLSKAIGD